MIILKLNEGTYEKRKKLRRKKRVNEDLFNYTRTGLIINNKPHFVISVEEKHLVDEDFKKLLGRYKGEIIASEKLSQNEFISGLLFNEKPYLKKAIYESFLKLFNNKRTKSLNVFIKDMPFDLKDDLPSLLPEIKSLTIKVQDEFLIRDWQRECFIEYGIRPNVILDNNSQIFLYDVVADFDKIKNKTLTIDFQGEQRTIYPDSSFFEISDELKFLENFDLESSTICAVFGSHHP